MNKKLFFFETDIEDCWEEIIPVFAQSLKEAEDIMEENLYDIGVCAYEKRHGNDDEDCKDVVDLEKAYENISVNLENYKRISTGLLLDVPYCNESCNESVKSLFIKHMENELKDLKAIDTDHSQDDLFSTEESEQYFEKLRELKRNILNDIKEIS